MSRDHTVTTGRAVLADQSDDSDTFTIHGVAIGSGDVTVGSSGVRKVWPEDELREAASTLEGKPLVKDHDNSVDGVIGRVTKSKFAPGRGVLYEAEITEQFEDVAQKIADGLLEVSVRAFHAPTEELEEDEELEALRVTDVVFDNMAVVPQGAAPSNTAQAGAATEMSAAELRAEFEDVDEEELSLHVIKVFGHVGLNEDFLDETSVDGLQSDLESHEAVTAVFSEEEHDLALVIDGDLVDSNDELDEHITSTLDDTPWEVFDDWTWLNSVDERLNSMDEIDQVIDELAFHGPVLDMIEDYLSMEDTSEDDSVSDFLEWADDDEAERAADAFVEDHEDVSRDSSVSRFRDWVEEDADMSDNSQQMNNEENTTPEVPDELAMVNGLEINGTVMWGDDNMGVISGFEQDGDSLMVQVDVMEQSDDGSFRKTGETVERALLEVESEEASPDVDRPVEELKTVAGVTFDGTSSGKLDESEIPNDDYESHYLYPADTKSESSYPVVDADGNLRAGNVAAAWSLGARGGVSEEDLHNKLESLNDEFEDPPIDPENFSDEEESTSGDPEDTEADTLQDYLTARIVDDSSTAISDGDPVAASFGSAQQTTKDSSTEDKTGTSDSTDTLTNNETTMEIDYRTVDGDELDEGYVAVDQDQLNAVVEKAERADKLDERLDNVNDTLEQLSQKTEILDEVDEEALEALRDHEDPVVKEREAYDSDMEAVDEVGGVFAELLAEEDSIFTAEELKERHSPLELKAKYEEQLDDDASLVDQLSESDPEPNGEDVEPEELGGGGQEAAEAEKREAFKGRLAAELESNGYASQAEQIREGTRKGEKMVDEYADKLGASFDE